MEKREQEIEKHKELLTDDEPACYVNAFLQEKRRRDYGGDIGAAVFQFQIVNSRRLHRTTAHRRGLRPLHSRHGDDNYNFGIRASLSAQLFSCADTASRRIGSPRGTESLSKSGATVRRSLLMMLGDCRI